MYIYIYIYIICNEMQKCIENNMFFKHRKSYTVFLLVNVLISVNELKIVCF